MEITKQHCARLAASLHLRTFSRQARRGGTTSGIGHWAPGQTEPDIAREDDTVGNPHRDRARIYKLEVFELILLLKFDKQFPVEEFAAAVSQSAVPTPPLKTRAGQFDVQEGAEDEEDRPISMSRLNHAGVCETKFIVK